MNRKFKDFSPRALLRLGVDLLKSIEVCLHTLEVNSKDQNHLWKQRAPAIAENSAPKHRQKPQKSDLNWSSSEGKGKFSSRVFARQYRNSAFHVLASSGNFITEQDITGWTE